ncbi:unnamed protein product [Lactuca virosa]|uniref:Uncharacterized protein n=1 Tax=Lactuca virosa TaxID=75947 RepID=A0AAU9PTY3_9ASTR|nr:unnamed protein product [Lactuca virosa]
MAHPYLSTSPAAMAANDRWMDVWTEEALLDAAATVKQLFQALRLPSATLFHCCLANRRQPPPLPPVVAATAISCRHQVVAESVCKNLAWLGMICSVCVRMF